MKKPVLTKEQKAVIARYKDREDKIMTYAKKSKYGLTSEEVRQYFGDQIMKTFGDWLDGQTCAMTPEGECVMYPYDIDRFLGMLIHRIPTVWD